MPHQVVIGDCGVTLDGNPDRQRLCHLGAAGIAIREKASDHGHQESFMGRRGMNPVAPPLDGKGRLLRFPLRPCIARCNG
jgi:hypothetical protein